MFEKIIVNNSKKWKKTIDRRIKKMSAMTTFRGNSTMIIIFSS